MHGILERCSPAKIRRLGGEGGPTLAVQRIVDEVRCLSVPQQQILVWQLGLDGGTADVTTIAERLALPVDRVERLLEQALVDLGFALIGAAPTDLTIIGVVAPLDPGAARADEEWEAAA